MNMFMFKAFKSIKENAIAKFICTSKSVGGCERDIKDEFDSWDSLTQDEYMISAMCKDCQDKFFGE